MSAAVGAGTTGTAAVDARYAFGGLAGAAVIILLGNTRVSPGDNGGLMPALVTGALCFAGLRVYLGLKSGLSRHLRHGRTAHEGWANQALLHAPHRAADGDDQDGSPS